MEKYKIKKICFELRAVHIKYPEVFPLTTHSVWTKNMMKLLRGKKGNTPFYSWLSKNWRNSRHILVSFDPILFSTRPYIFKRNLFFFFGKWNCCPIVEGSWTFFRDIWGNRKCMSWRNDDKDNIWIPRFETIMWICIHCSFKCQDLLQFSEVIRFFFFFKSLSLEDLSERVVSQSIEK